MGLNIGSMLQLKKSWDIFSRNHPKVPAFLAGLKGKGVQENMEIAVAIRYPDGTEYKTGIRLTQSDIDQIAVLKDLKAD